MSELLRKIAQDFVGKQTADLYDLEVQICEGLIDSNYLAWADAEEPTLTAGPKLQVAPPDGRIFIPVCSMVFDPMKDTIYVNNHQDITVLRIKARDGIKVHKLDATPASHCDIYVEANMVVHLAPDAVSG